MTHQISDMMSVGLGECLKRVNSFIFLLFNISELVSTISAPPQNHYVLYCIFLYYVLSSGKYKAVACARN